MTDHQPTNRRDDQTGMDEVERRLRTDADAFNREAARLDYDGAFHRTLDRLGLTDAGAESSDGPPAS